MELELVIRYLGFGERCSHCGRVRETTKYTLRHGEEQLQQFRLCDACQDQGFSISFRPPNKDRKAIKKEKKRRIKLSRKLEQGVAEDLGGRTTPGSGNRDTKADIRKLDEWRIEHKYTENTASYSLKVNDLRAIIRHANLAGEWPAMVLNFTRIKRQFVILPYELFLGILEKLRG